MSRCALSLAVLSLALVPGVAAAQSSPEPGVHVDPNSPSHKEYAIPLDEARGNATPSGVKKKTTPAGTTQRQTPATTTEAAPLFGAGITPDHAKPKGKSKKTAAKDQTATPTDDSSDATSTKDAAAIAAASRSGGGGDGGGLAAPIGIGVLVLVLGGGLGYLVRRRSSAAARGHMRPGSSEL
jgi:hypothetical protein